MSLTADLPPLDIARDIPGPVHVFVGERSPAELHSVAEQLSGALGSPVITVPKQDHMVSAKVLLPALVARCPEVS
jgi:hypothetical protein